MVTRPASPVRLSPVRAGVTAGKAGVAMDNMSTAEAVPQAGHLSNDQVDEGIDQLVEHLQVLVFFEAAKTLPGHVRKKEERIRSQNKIQNM